MVWSGNRDSERAFVSVYHPQCRVWSPAHQVDSGPAQLGRYSRTVAVAISGDRTVHALWGMSDPDFRDNDPPSGIWAGSSTDFGTSWSLPQRTASDCRRVNDRAATPLIHRRGAGGASYSWRRVPGAYTILACRFWIEVQTKLQAP